MLEPLPNAGWIPTILDPLLKDALFAWAPYVAGLVALDVYLIRRFRRWWQIVLLLLPTALLGFYVYIEVTLTMAFGTIIDALLRKH